MRIDPALSRKILMGIIVNPYSRRNLKNREATVDDFVRTGGSAVDVRPTESLEHLDDVLREFKENAYPYIGISGGDGTIHNVITRIINIYMPEPPPPVLLFNDGTMNNIAASIGLGGDSAQILKRFLAAVTRSFYPRMLYRDTLKIEDRYCFLFGMGMIANFLNECYSDGQKGFRKNIEAIGKTFGEVLNSLMTNTGTNLDVMKHMEAEVRINSRKIGFHNMLFLLAGTVENIGMGFRALYRANDIPGTFHVFVNGMQPIDLAGQLNRFLSGTPVESNVNIDETVRKLEICTDCAFEYTMDGDMYSAHSRIIVETGVPVRLLLV
ncbi:MAG: diacylglycerol/lipid kinase family protein [Spirochaetota bacterium]